MYLRKVNKKCIQVTNYDNIFIPSVVGVDRENDLSEVIDIFEVDVVYLPFIKALQHLVVKIDLNYCVKFLDDFFTLAVNYYNLDIP